MNILNFEIKFDFEGKHMMNAWGLFVVSGAVAGYHYSKDLQI